MIHIGKQLWENTITEDMAEKQISEKVIIQTYPHLTKNIYECFVNSAKRLPDKEAVVDNWGRAYSYGDLYLKVQQFSAWLYKSMNVRKGQHVALMLFNSVEFCVAFLALNRIGAVVVLLPTKYRKEEIGSLTEKADITLVICDEKFENYFESNKATGIRVCKIPSGENEYALSKFTLRDEFLEMEEGEETTPSDMVLLMFTSGTTSQSKGVTITNYNIMHAIVETNGGSNIGGIMGVANSGTSSFELCYFDGEVKQTTAAYDAGGILGKQQAANVDIKHCLSSGIIISSGQRVGGILGRVEGNAKVNASLSVYDSFNMSEVTAVNQKGTILGSLGSNVTYNMGDGTTYGISEAGANGVGGAISRDKSKEISAFDMKLDYQKYWSVHTNSGPVLRYYEEGNLQVPDTRWFESPVTDTVTGKLVYTLSDVDDLYGFALLSQTNAFDNSIVRLHAEKEFSVNEKGTSKWKWTPIAKYTAFQGTFDGQGQTIRGIHAEGASHIALFAYAHTDSVIQNFRLEDSSFCATGSFSYASSIAARGNGTIANVYSNADVEGTGYHIAGFVAEITGDYNVATCRTIKNCWFDGTVTLLNKDCHNVGGFIATTTNTTAPIKIEDCMFTGTLTNEVSTTAGGRVGGFVGGFNGTNTIIRDCLSAGTIINKGTTSGSIVGYNGAKSLNLSNVYAVTESCISGTTHMSVGGKANASVIDMSKNDMKGETGYTKVLLSYDRPETPNVVEGNWVIRTNKIPALKMFVDSKEVHDITGIYKAHTSWHDIPIRTEEDGTEVFAISTPEDLLGLSSLVANKVTFDGEKVILTADIKFNNGDALKWSEHKETPAFTGWVPIGKNTTYYFAGTFDGQGHTVSGIYCSDNAEGVALFGYIHPNGTVQNLKLKDSYFASTADYVGSIAGWGLGTIQNVYSNAYVSGVNSCGGLVAYISNAFYQARNDEKISNCWFDGNVTISGINAGGIIGKVRYNQTSVTIEHCYNSGNVHSSASSYGRASGFVGDLQNDCTVIIRDSLTTGNLTGSHVGKIFGCIENSSVADVGTNSTYAISGANKGADTKMVGHLGSLKTGTVAGEVTHEQLTGNNASTYTGLDFTTYWVIQNDKYPVLATFIQ